MEVPENQATRVDNKNEDIINEISKVKSEISKTKKDILKEIDLAVIPKFLDVSIQTKDLIELAIEIWRMENRIEDIQSLLPEEKKLIFKNSMQKIKRYLEKNDIEIIDHTNDKYNSGMNLTLLGAINDPSIKESIVKETREPTIKFKGHVVKPGKVIILQKGDRYP